MLGLVKALNRLALAMEVSNLRAVWLSKQSAHYAQVVQNYNENLTHIKSQLEALCQHFDDVSEKPGETWH